MERDVLAEVERIVSSREFARSERLSRFLRFTVKHALAGQQDQLKESVIGLEVFDRKAAYDPRLDPIVRVEARRLRAKLEKYYAEEGRADSIRIDFPTGSYVPVFRPAAAQAAAAPPRSIAVLPLQNLSPEPGSEHLAEGITEELIHALIRVEELRVIAAPSIFKLAGEARDLSAVKERLQVETVLQGSLRRAADRVRVSVQLVSVSDGRYLWSETYDREIRDLLAIQEEIARAIVSALRVRLSGSVRLAPAVAHPEAYGFYLKGRSHMRERTQEGMQRSVEYFRRAVTLDPAYSSAHAGLADCFVLLAQYGVSRPREVMGLAIESASRALELDRANAEAHSTLGLVKCTYAWEWEESIWLFRRALEFSPGLAEAHHWYGSDCLGAIGRCEEGLAHLRLAIELDPLSPVHRGSLSGLLISMRRYDEAMAESARTIDADPGYYRGYVTMGRACLQKGDFGAALELFEKGRTLSGNLPYVRGIQAHAHAVSGQLERARALAAELAETARNQYVPFSTQALVALGLGETETALTLLERAAEEREAPLILLNTYPTYDSLRGHPRFTALLDRIGFPRCS